MGLPPQVGTPTVRRSYEVHFKLLYIHGKEHTDKLLTLTHSQETNITPHPKYVHREPLQCAWYSSQN